VRLFVRHGDLILPLTLGKIYFVLLVLWAVVFGVRRVLSARVNRAAKTHGRKARPGETAL
jgi:hypothetical protein